MRKLLTVLGSHPGGRSAMTCRFRCGDACFHEAPNTSGNEYAGDVIARVLSRRSVLRAGAVASVATAVTVTGACSGDAGAVPAGDAAKAKGKPAKGLRFTPVKPNTDDKVTVPEGYGQNIVIRWGEPILRGAPDFDPEKQSAKAQEGQFGYNNDFLSLLPLDEGEEREGGGRRQLMVANHEYTDEILMFAGYDSDDPTREQAEIAWAAHGLSVVVVEGESGGKNATARCGPSPATDSTAASPPPPPSRSRARRRAASGCVRPPIRTGGRSSAPSTTAPAAPPRGARRCTARRTSTSTSPTPRR